MNTHTVESCLSDLAEHIIKSPSDSVCLVAKNEQCSAINNAMLEKLKSPLFILKAVDCIEAKTIAQKEKALKSLRKFADTCSKTAGLEEEIQIKVGAKIMLLRNVEVSSGLVNGAIGIVTKINKSLDSKKVEKLTIDFVSVGERELEPLQSKFPLQHGVYVVRKQFPIRLAYAITIHKSQGLTVEYCIVDCGDSIFSNGQIYVALSRIPRLDGLIIINLNPRHVKVENRVIIEYNRLRGKHRSDLSSLIECVDRNQDLTDQNNYSKKLRVQIIEPTVVDSIEGKSKKSKDKENESITIGTMHGFINYGNNCWANSTLQCLLNLRSIHNAIMLAPSNGLKKVFMQYDNLLAGTLDLTDLRTLFSAPDFQIDNQQDCTDFLLKLINEFSVLKPLCRFNLMYHSECPCGQSNTVNRPRTDLIYILHVPPSRSSRSIQELIDFNYAPVELVDSYCDYCMHQRTQRRVIENPSDVLIFHLQLATNVPNEKITNFKLSNVAQSTLKICEKEYVLSGAIFHHGTRLVDSSNHYTAIIRKNNMFIKANDSILSKCSWPRQSKDLFVLFYEIKK